MSSRKTVNLDKEEDNEKVKIEEMPEEVAEEVRNHVKNILKIF